MKKLKNWFNNDPYRVPLLWAWGFVVLLIILFLIFCSCTSSHPFPYLEKEQLGQVRFSRAEQFSTFVKTDSTNLYIEGRHNLPIGEKAVYYRKYPNTYRPKVLVVGRRQYEIK